MVDRAIPSGRATAADAVEPVPVSSKAGVPIAEWRDGADLTGFKWPLSAYAPGNYMAKCHGCGDTIYNIDKRALLCLRCAIEALAENRLSLERALRIRLWNDAKGRGVSDRAAMAEIEEGIRKATAQGMSAGTAKTPKAGKGPQDG